MMESEIVISPYMLNLGALPLHLYMQDQKTLNDMNVRRIFSRNGEISIISHFQEDDLE
jgi:hypothetical protein